ncbi:hypothetical protein GUITHDRAFT_143314 [Guillardia theta CCMP2712]|uniref:Glycosyl transferase 64 domain-containing protein n=2 Tax=Guillardia theta TaxID=55529 RepID=L1IU23_GUITC|nr:hypothetical protein GUITHDRAFT_143314 [Guillardia theta CCMP2712]EKX39738.1 hypothetical protein GUITHDRAFT_143314 [Guillardia theta CCMP2712]|eukprot:XP_005826718.1 hypothetical protein GUITHDRAFT_143314 [Guillardia theta CCMP2712]
MSLPVLIAALLVFLPVVAGKQADTLVVILHQRGERELNLLHSIDFTDDVQSILVFAHEADKQLLEEQTQEQRVRVITRKYELERCSFDEHYIVVLEDTLTYAADWISVAKNQVDAIGRRAVVGARGFVWNKHAITRTRSLSNAMISFPTSSEQPHEFDVWVDVLQVGSLSFHSSLTEPNVLLRLLEAFRSGLADLHFSTYLLLHEIARLSFSCPSEWLPVPSPSTPPAFFFPQRIEQLRGESRPALLLALQFAPWRTRSLPEASTFLVKLRVADESIGSFTYTLVEVDPQQDGEEEHDCPHVPCIERREQGESGSNGSVLASTWGSHCEGKLTVVMPVFWKPRACFSLQTVRQLVGMDIVDRVLILWNNKMWSKNSSIASLIMKAEACGGGLKGDKVVVVDPSDRGASKSSLNHRFLPWEQIRTEAVVSMDDDFRPEEEQLKKLLEVWCSFPETLVGPMWLTTRSLACKDASCAELTYVTGGWPGYYNLILTGFALFHRGWLVKYSEEEGVGEMAEGRRVVDAYGSCEDILLNFLVAKETGRAPIAVEVGDVQEMEDNVGLSSIGSHFHARSRCSNAFLLPFPRFPLHTNHKGEHRTDVGAFLSGEHAAAERAAEDAGRQREQEEDLDKLRSAWRRHVEEVGKEDLGATAPGPPTPWEGEAGSDSSSGERPGERRVVVATVLYSSLEYLELQVESLNAFLLHPHVFVAAVDSPTPELRTRFLLRCADLRVQCHRTPLSDEEEEFELSERPSYGHMLALQWLLHSVIFKEFADDVLLILDPDVFLIRPFSVFRFHCDGDASCGIFSPRSSPHPHPCDITGFAQVAGGVKDSDSLYLYLHVGVLLLDLPRMPMKHTLSLAPVAVNEVLHDSGGSLVLYFLRLIETIPHFRILEYPYSAKPWWSSGVDELWEEEEREGKLVVCYLQHNYSSDACFNELGACDLQQPGGSDRCPAGLPDLISGVFLHIRKSSGWDEQRSFISSSSRRHLRSSRMVRMQCALGYVRRLVSLQLGHRLVDLSENNVGAADFSWEPIDFQVRGQVEEGSDDDICRALPPPSSASPLELDLARPLDLQALFLAPIDSSRSLRWHGGQLEEKVRKLQTSCVLELEEVEVLSS